MIVTDKLLTGYDAPLLYCMYLDKPMHDHVLLQASGVIEDLDVLLADFQAKITDAEKNHLDIGEGGDADERLERVVYGRFLEPEAGKAFFDCYKDIEALWEILSPSPQLRDHIATFKRLAQLYAAVRNAYADKVGYEADLAYKTRRLVQENATQDGLGRLTKSVIFDLRTLEALRGEKGSDEGKVIFNLVRGLQKEIDDDPNIAPRGGEGAAASSAGRTRAEVIAEASQLSPLEEVLTGATTRLAESHLNDMTTRLSYVTLRDIGITLVSSRGSQKSAQDCISSRRFSIAVPRR